MENEQVYQQETQEVKVTPEAKAYFVEAANWGTFLAILGYLFLALVIIMAIYIMAMGGKFSQGMDMFEQYYGMQGSSSALKFGTVFTGVIMLLIAVLYFFPIYYLHQFSSKVKYGVNSMKQEAFEVGIKNLKSLFKFMGIVTIITLALYVLALIFVLLGMAIGS